MGKQTEKSFVEKWTKIIKATPLRTCKQCRKPVDPTHPMAKAYRELCGPCADNLAQHMNDMRP